MTLRPILSETCKWTSGSFIKQVLREHHLYAKHYLTVGDIAINLAELS
jgi:hypothetical protein